ncbi:MAG: hypothetical protein WCQ95_07775 [Bacteroidota bacterium]
MDGSYQGEYNLNCSQSRNVFGLAFRGGFLVPLKNFIIEPYASIGLRFINANTAYNYYQVRSSGGGFSHLLYYGKPSGNALDSDNKFNFRPSANLGIKIGVGWPHTELTKKILRKKPKPERRRPYVPSPFFH